MTSGVKWPFTGVCSVGLVALLARWAGRRVVFRMSRLAQQLGASRCARQEITDADELCGVDDCCALTNISPASILHTVRVRYARRLGAVESKGASG